MPERKLKRNLIQPRTTITLLVAIVGSFLGTSIAYSHWQEKSKRQTRLVTRVKRPTFDRKQWQLTYFDNVFEQGLVGQRPDAQQLAANSRATNSQATKGSAGASSNSGGTDQADTGGFKWSSFIAREVIEDEVKTLQQRLNTQVTTPSKFKTEYAKARQSFAVLSMLFGIIREYDDEIRWKKDAAQAQVDFQTAASNARVGSSQAYQSCKKRKDSLVEMVRGGTLASDAKAPEEMEWSQVIDLTPIMVRLTASQDLMKPMVANKTEFSSNIEDLLHEASLVAAMAQVLTREDMTNADDDEYLEYAIKMQKAASEIVEACKSNDYDSASEAVNGVQQSCSICHEVFR